MWLKCGPSRLHSFIHVFYVHLQYIPSNEFSTLIFYCPGKTEKQYGKIIISISLNEIFLLLLIFYSSYSNGYFSNKSCFIHKFGSLYFFFIIYFCWEKKTRQSTYTTIWESIYHPTINILLSQKSSLMLRKINQPLIIMPAMKGIIEGGGNTKMNKE